MPLPSMTQSRVPCQVHYGKQCSQITNLSLLLCSSNVPFSNSVTPPLYWPSGFDERQVDNFGAPIQSQITLSIFDSCAHPFHNSSLQRTRQLVGMGEHELLQRECNRTAGKRPAAIRPTLVQSVILFPCLRFSQSATQIVQYNRCGFS